MADSLVQLAIQLICTIVSTIIVIGIIGNSINIVVLSRSTLHNHACSRYFLALAGNNLFLSSAFLINRLLITVYQLDVTKISLLSCKLIQYVTGICVVISPYFIVHVSIDRYCATLCYIDYLVFIDLRQDDSLGCAIRGDIIYKKIYSITQFIVFAIIPPCLMGFFGGMTIYNMKHIYLLPRVAKRYCRTENQLGRMLLLQVDAYILLTLPLSISYLILVLPNSFKITTQFQFMYLICQLFYYLSCVTIFILYFFSANIYRNEYIRLIYQMSRIYRETRIHLTRTRNSILPITTTSNNTRALASNSTRRNASIQKH
ncbi:unnamed protein product [Rotaria sordida]|uniref:G-protein coupled receptors family 1 profile domain-containing protein n=1 Tax=Rotaria sordida TaxID=392033 RepID=A0A814Z299_9BILA|nr:unnamed protein product [Rotaria sordida]CAF1521688.1 unnamed protein product [Rotaria sordida]